MIIIIILICSEFQLVWLAKHEPTLVMMVVVDVDANYISESLNATCYLTREVVFAVCRRSECRLGNTKLHNNNNNN